MEISYIKDIHHNYLVVSANEEKSDEAYCVKMLEANSIGGIIRPENRIIDGQVLYYYEITSKQSFDIIYAKAAINYEKIRRLFTDLLEIINQAYEYLLNANDLVIDPEHIYIELSTRQAYVCYLPGYNTEINKQIIKLIEYIMNKLEYKDKEAVLYVYNLYSICKEEGASFNNFYEAVKKDKLEGPIITDTKPNRQEHQAPIMMEKILDETELSYYSIQTYIYTGLCALAALFVLYLSYASKIIYTSIRNRVDYCKLTALILILFCIIGYLMKKIWAKNMRATKIVSTERYLDPRNEEKEEKEEKEENNQRIDISKQDLLMGQSEPLDKLDQSDEYTNQTVLLNAESKDGYRGECCLKPEGENICEPIWIYDFPFVIGKQKDNVDYYLDKEVVSRYHVKITKEENKYYITDLNSTNGTHLNNIPLPCYQRYEITQEDEVTIAGLKYLVSVHP